MPARGLPIVVHYEAWDTQANAPKTGDAANHTLRWARGLICVPLTNPTPTEVSAADFPGLYAVQLTATETDVDFGTLGGRSSTANVAITSIPIAFDPLSVIRGTVSDANPAASSFVGDSALSTTEGFYVGSVLEFTSGTLRGLARRIAAYDGPSRTFSFAAPFPAAPENGSAFSILGRIDAP